MPCAAPLVAVVTPIVSGLQTANGNVEAKVVCFYRRRDIPGTLIALADKHASKWPTVTRCQKTWQQRCESTPFGSPLQSFCIWWICTCSKLQSSPRFVFWSNCKGSFKAPILSGKDWKLRLQTAARLLLDLNATSCHVSSNNVTIHLSLWTHDPSHFSKIWMRHTVLGILGMESMNGATEGHC